MPFFPGAMPFFRAPCPFSERHAFKMCPFLPKCYRVECDAIELTATPYVLVHGTPKVARPPDASQLPLYAAVKTLLIEGSHLTRGGVNASPITPGRTLPWPTFKPTISVYTTVYISILYLWSKRLLINTQDIYWDTYEKFIFKVTNMINEVFFYIYDLMFRHLSHQSFYSKKHYLNLKARFVRYSNK